MDKKEKRKKSSSRSSSSRREKSEKSEKKEKAEKSEESAAGSSSRSSIQSSSSFGKPPPSLRGTHNRPWQREASNSRSPDVATDEDYYDFASMDVVMAPTPAAAASTVSAPAASAATTTPAAPVTTSPSSTTSGVSAYDKYRQMSKRPPSAAASTTLTDTTPIISSTSIGSQNSSATTASLSSLNSSSTTIGDSKLSSYERYRQHRQKQQQQQQQMGASKSPTATSRPSVNLTAGLQSSRSSAPRSPPKTRQVFTYDSAEAIKRNSKPTAAAAAADNNNNNNTQVDPSSAFLYKMAQKPGDTAAAAENGDKSARQSKKSTNFPATSPYGTASKLTGGANELKAALATLQKKKEHRSTLSAPSLNNSGATALPLSASARLSARDLRKSRLTAAAAPVTIDKASEVPAATTTLTVNTDQASTERPPTVPSPRSNGSPITARSPSPASGTHLMNASLGSGGSSNNMQLPPTGRRSSSPHSAARLLSTTSKTGAKAEDRPSLFNQNSTVGRYLATRDSRKSSNSDLSQKDALESESAKNAHAATETTTRTSGYSAAQFVSDDDSQDDGENSSMSSDGGDDVFDPSEKCDGWSVRVCIVSAVDFPINVVPNLPLSPVLRVALVPLAESSGGDPSATMSEKDRLQRSIDSSGVASVKKARIRCTSSKITSKRDNGSVEFHEEMRWDYVENPERTALAVELSARAVMAPANIRESPYTQNVQPIQFPSSTGSIGRATGMNRMEDPTGQSGIGALFRAKHRKNAPSAEMETANAAAAVAKHLVEEGQKSSDDNEEDDAATNNSDANSASASSRASGNNQSEMDVKLRKRKKPKKPKMTDDIRLGSQVIPLTDLPLKKSMEGNETARIEQWFQLETPHAVSPSSNQSSSKTPTRRNPSVLLEITFSSRKSMDDSEDDMDEATEKPELELSASFSRRASMKIRNQLKKESKPVETLPKKEEPVLEPGIVDYICVVGARDIGNQTSDDGSSGWVNTTPECGLLEQFPPNQEFLAKRGRNVALPDKVEWFCFPEGCRLWRGTTPPNSEELNLKRFSASSPANIATTIASFDACLGCTTSFSWFVLASNSEEYGSQNMKTYGACIRFYVPAPVGIDQTQDDFAQFGAVTADSGGVAQKRLWVPLGICVTSLMPIVGTLEVVLLRVCEALSSPGSRLGNECQPSLEKIYEDVLNLVLGFHRPIPGLVQCSVPFLTGEPLRISLGPVAGLPPLPHGSSVTSVCRLLGADGIVFLLAALLTESKILLHSDDTANLSLVAEVASALLYPFHWSCPYIPVLPFAMMEFIEAPMPYLVGIPTCNFKMVDPYVLEDIVVVDLDKDITDGEYFDDPPGGTNSKIPTALPASTASNISKAVYRLLQADTGFEVVDQVPDANGRTFPRMQGETNIEREFRIAVAMEVCGLVRGYQDCLVYASSSQPMFNVDKFLQNAPILFEEQRGTTAAAAPRHILSPRSRRFMSIFVNCQHFHQFLESEQQHGKHFFHDIMSELDAFGAKKDFLAVKRVLSLDAQKTIDLLRASLKRLDDRMTNFSAKRIEATKLDMTCIKELSIERFPMEVLNPIEITSKGSGNDTGGGDDGVKHISLEYLVELEKNPWRYQQLFSIDSNLIENFSELAEKVKITDAIGERRYRTWLNANDRADADDTSVFSDENSVGAAAVDLGSLLAYNSDETSDTSTTEEPANTDAQRRVADAKDRDVLRRCLERANVSKTTGQQNKSDSLHDLISGAETSLRNPSARRFLLSVLTKLSKAQKDSEGGKIRRRTTAVGASKLEKGAFETLIRLGCAMLDACMEDRDYNSAYSLLKLTAGLYCNVGDGDNSSVTYMTQKIGHHPIYADLGVWERAKEIHLVASRKDSSKQSSDDEVEGNDDEYEAAVATLYEMLGYGIPAEELARFASRVSENSGWFRSERGQSLLLLARRICMRRDQGDSTNSSKTSDLEMMSPSGAKPGLTNSGGGRRDENISVRSEWVEVGWVHPAAQSSRRMMADRSKRGGSGQVSPAELQRGASDNSTYMKRSAITTMAYLGSSVIASGGLDGGVFLARKVRSPAADVRIENGVDPCDIRGVHLDWGSSGSRYAVGSSAASLDGEYGVGAVSCLAGTRAAYQSYQSMIQPSSTPKKDTVDSLGDEEVLNAMEGARVVAGTTCGDLRVWSVKDVLSAVFYANQGGDFGASNETRTLRGEGTSSTFLNKRKGGTDFAAGSSLTRLKFSLRGRALSGHRGGVSCVDVPSHVYRPDSIISGGADGLIKLWSLRTSGAGRRNEIDQGSMLAAASKGSTESMTSRAKSSRSGDALSILSGHGGRILCIKTAWHGDRLLSGGADRTVRVWDLAGSGGKCLHSLSGHFGWVTSVQYWGPNTIISASTDRSIALWDARVRNSPLFALRHHNAPISSVLVGTRTDPIMVSSASDGTIAAWDFRHLSDAESGSKKLCKVARSPAAKLYLHDFGSRRKVCGPVHLSRGPNSDKRSILCVGRDATVREWNILTGDVVSEHITGHCDTISTFSTFQGESLIDTQLETTASEGTAGTITTSWDGTVRMRSQVVRKA